MAGVQNDATKGLKDGAREVFHGIAKGLIQKYRHYFKDSLQDSLFLHQEEISEG